MTGMVHNYLFLAITIAEIAVYTSELGIERLLTSCNPFDLYWYSSWRHLVLIIITLLISYINHQNIHYSSRLIPIQFMSLQNIQEWITLQLTMRHLQETGE